MKSDVSYLELLAKCIVILLFHIVVLLVAFLFSFEPTARTLAPIGNIW